MSKSDKFLTAYLMVILYLTILFAVIELQDSVNDLEQRIELCEERP